MSSAPPGSRAISRSILLLVEEEALEDLLAEALAEAGHIVARLPLRRALDPSFVKDEYQVAVVDLSIRAIGRISDTERLHGFAPWLRVIALLPWGGLGPTHSPPPFYVSVEMPARIGDILAAIDERPIDKA